MKRSSRRPGLSEGKHCDFRRISIQYATRVASIYERKTMDGQIGQDAGAVGEDSASESNKRKVNNPSVEGKERSVIFMGSYDRVPTIFSFSSRLVRRCERRTSARETKRWKMVAGLAASAARTGRNEP